MLIPSPLTVLCNHISQQGRTRHSVPPAYQCDNHSTSSRTLGCLQKLQICLTSRIQHLQMAATIFHLQGLTVPQAQNFLHPQARKNSLSDEKLRARCHNTTGAAAGSTPKPFLWHIAEMEESQNHKSWKKTCNIINSNLWLNIMLLTRPQHLWSLLEHLQGLVTSLLPRAV